MKLKILALIAVVGLVGCNEEERSKEVNKFVRQADSPVYSGDRSDLLAYGEKLWNDPSIGNSGLACSSCHAGGGAFSAGFKQPYPHQVAMAENLSGLTSVDAEQMVQFCMLQPMQAEIFAWDSKELAALTLYVEKVVQVDYIKQNL